MTEYSVSPKSVDSKIQVSGLCYSPVSYRYTSSSMLKQSSQPRMKRKRTRERFSVSHMRCSFMTIYVYFIGGLFDDEEMSNDEADVVSRAGLSDIGTSIKDLQDEATRIVATARNNTRSSYTTFEDIPLPFRVPRSTDPSIWSVRVKVGILHYL